MKPRTLAANLIGSLLIPEWFGRRTPAGLPTVQRTRWHGLAEPLELEKRFTTSRTASDKPPATQTGADESPQILSKVD